MHYDSAAFTPSHLIVGTTTSSSQLLSGISVSLPSPPYPDPERASSSLTIDISRRRIKFVAYCQGCEGGNGESIGDAKRAMWPLDGEISFDSLVPRGVRLDEVNLERREPSTAQRRIKVEGETASPSSEDLKGNGWKRKERDDDGYSSDSSIEIISPPNSPPPKALPSRESPATSPQASSSRPRRSRYPRAPPHIDRQPLPPMETSAPPLSYHQPQQERVFNLRIILRRPPQFRYHYPEGVLDDFDNGDGHEWNKKRYPRRSTEEDFIVLDGGEDGTSGASVDPLNVVGLGGKEAFFNVSTL